MHCTSVNSMDWVRFDVSRYLLVAFELSHRLMRHFDMSKSLTLSSGDFELI